VDAYFQRLRQQSISTGVGHARSAV
jgi:hypothetical protein